MSMMGEVQCGGTERRREVRGGTVRRSGKAQASTAWHTLLLIPSLLFIAGKDAAGAGGEPSRWSSRTGVTAFTVPGGGLNVPGEGALSPPRSHCKRFQCVGFRRISVLRCPRVAAAPELRAVAQLGLTDMRTFADAAGVTAEFLHVARSADADPVALTAQAAAGLLEVDPAQIAKSILFLADGQPVLVVLSGNTTVNPRRLRGQLNSPAHNSAGVWAHAPSLKTPVSRVVLASPSEAVAVTGYRIGTIGPFGHIQPIPTIVDKRLACYTEVYAGCGAANREMRLATADLIRVAACNGLRLLDVVAGAPPAPWLGARSELWSGSRVPYSSFHCAWEPLDILTTAADESSVDGSGKLDVWAKVERLTASRCVEEETSRLEQTASMEEAPASPGHTGSSEMLSGTFAQGVRVEEGSHPDVSCGKLNYVMKSGLPAPDGSLMEEERPYVDGLECEVISKQKIGRRLLFAAVAPLALRGDGPVARPAESLPSLGGNGAQDQDKTGKAVQVDDSQTRWKPLVSSQACDEAPFQKARDEVGNTGSVWKTWHWADGAVAIWGKDRRPEEQGLWRKKAGQSSFVLQLVMGKTLTRLLGDAEAGHAMGSLRVGDVVKVSGYLQAQDCEAVAHPRPDQIDLIVSKYQRLARSASLQRKSEKEGGGEGRLLETEAALGDVRGAAVNPRRQASQADERVGPAQPTPVLESTFSELSLSRILVVHNVEEWRVAAKGLMMSLADASRHGFPVVVGVDAEWVPFAFLDQGVDGGNRRQRVCVLQISTRDLAVVVDLCAWMAGHGTEGEEKLEELASVILREDILKVGFGIALDVKMLRESFPGVSCFHRFDELTQRQWGYLDIQDMVLARDKQLPRGERLGINVGLSKTCLAVFGTPLDKREQTSDWSARPLTAAQLHYAATDAQSVVRIYERLAVVAEQARELAFRRIARSGRKQARKTVHVAQATAPCRRCGAVVSSDCRCQRESLYAWRRFHANKRADAGGVGLGGVGGSKGGSLTNWRTRVGFTVGGRGRDGVALFTAGHVGTRATCGGCLEFEHPPVVALLVNVGWGRYRNDFQVHDGKMTVSWTTSLPDVNRSPILARALTRVGMGNGRGGLSEGTGVEDEGSVLLFSRLKGGSYVLMSRLELLEVKPTQPDQGRQGASVELIWHLIDADLLEGSARAGQILRVGMAHAPESVTVSPHQ